MTGIRNEGGLLVTGAEDKPQCLGHLIDFGEKGVFEPTLGRVDVSPELVGKHNELLDQALVNGLGGCEVGQRGSFYYCGDRRVTTFTGALVSDSVFLSGDVITFQRDDKKFRGRLQKDSQVFSFKRVA